MTHRAGEPYSDAPGGRVPPAGRPGPPRRRRRARRRGRSAPPLSSEGGVARGWIHRRRPFARAQSPGHAGSAWPGPAPSPDRPENLRSQLDGAGSLGSGAGQRVQPLQRFYGRGQPRDGAQTVQSQGLGRRRGLGQGAQGVGGGPPAGMGQLGEDGANHSRLRRQQGGQIDAEGEADGSQNAALRDLRARFDRARAGGGSRCEPVSPDKFPAIREI